MIGLVVAAGTLSGVLASPATARLQAWLGVSGLLWLMLLASAIAMAVTGLLQDLLPLALVGIIWGLGIGITLPPLMTLVAQYTRPAERGLGTALRNTGNEWSIMVSPVVFGLLAERGGLDGAFLWFGLALSVLSAVGLVVGHRLIDRGPGPGR